MKTIDEKIKELRGLTHEFLTIEYYSHTKCDMYKIKNIYTKYNEDKIVLGAVSDGIENSIDIAIRVITAAIEKLEKIN